MHLHVTTWTVFSSTSILCVSIVASVGGAFHVKTETIQIIQSPYPLTSNKGFLIAIERSYIGPKLDLSGETSH